MLAKSKKSAVIMGLVSAFSMQATVMILSAISHWLGVDLEASFWIFANKSITHLILNILSVLLGITIFAALIYKRFDQNHFGVGGMIRWMIFGSIYALSFQLYIWLSPPLLQEIGIRWLVISGLIYLSHWLAFRSPFEGTVKPKPEAPDVSC